MRATPVDGYGNKDRARRFSLSRWYKPRKHRGPKDHRDRSGEYRNRFPVSRSNARLKPRDMAFTELFERRFAQPTINGLIIHVVPPS